MNYSHGLISVALFPQINFVAYHLISFRANLVKIIPRFEQKILLTRRFSWCHCLPHDIGK